MTLGASHIPTPSNATARAVHLQRTKVLEELENLVGKIIEHHGSQEKYEDDFHGGLGSWGVYERMERSKSRGMGTERISEMFRDEHRVEYMIGIMENLTKAVKDLHLDFKSKMKPISLKLSKGLESLPDDILSLIFEFANPTGEGTKQAVWLSHVSLRFRRVSLGSCHLWTTLHSRASKDELDALLARCGTKSDLNIVILVPYWDEAETYSKQLHDFSSTLNFLDICAPLAHRWKTFSIWSYKEDSEYSPDPESVDAAMACIFLYFPLSLPRLQEMRITQRRNNDRDTNPTDSWTSGGFDLSKMAPNLHSIICDDYIPSPLPNYPSLRSFNTSFSLTAGQYSSRLEKLQSFLDSAKAITDLQITIRELVTNVQAQPVQLKEMLCSSLTSFSLQFSPLTLPAAPFNLVLPLMESFVMPNLTTLSVSLEFRYDDLLDDPEDSDALQDLVLACLPDYETHTKLTSFNIEFTHTKEKRNWGLNHIRNKCLTIPLDKIPYVTKLSVRMFCRLSFDDRFSSMNKLRELCLHDCENYDWDFLKGTIESLMMEGSWNTLETIRLERCFTEEDYKVVLWEIRDKRLVFIPRDEIQRHQPEHYKVRL